MVSIGKYSPGKDPSMQLHTKTVRVVLSTIAFLFLASCSPQAGSAETEVVSAPTPSQQTLKTSMGDFVIASARLVDEVHDSQAPQGQKFLLIELVQPDLQKLVPGEFSLEAFQATIQESQNDIFIQGKDGSQSFYSHMGGWVEDDFVIGFTVPMEETYTLHWTDNAPIPLNVER
jgi:hypothetical protein